MEVDLTFIVIFGCSMLIMGAVAFMLGRVLDTHFRAKVLRTILRKDYGILGISSADGSRSSASTPPRFL